MTSNKIDLDILSKKNRKSEKGKSSRVILVPKKNVWNVEIFGSALNDRKKARLYSVLEILLSAGVDIRTSLELVALEQKKESDRKIIENIIENIIAGNSFSESLKMTKKFSPFEYFSFNIGEESGQLKKIFQELSKFYQQKVSLSRQVIGVLIYPSIVLLTSILAIFFMLNFVVPMFAGVFKRYGSDLPSITMLILSLSEFISHWYPIMILSILAFVIVFFNFRKEPWVRKLSSTILMNLPILGRTIKKIYLARFCNSMELLVSAHIQLTRAVDMVRQMIAFYPIEITLSAVKEDLINGQTLSVSMAKFPIYDKRLISLIKIGEEVNKLDEIFSKLRDSYSAEVEHETKIFGTLLEPLIIIVLGIIVGFILVAMYLPLFMLGTNIK